MLHADCCARGSRTCRVSEALTRQAFRKPMLRLVRSGGLPARGRSGARMTRATLGKRAKPTSFDVRQTAQHLLQAVHRLCLDDKRWSARPVTSRRTEPCLTDQVTVEEPTRPLND